MIVNVTKEARTVSIAGIPAQKIKVQWIDEDRMWEEEYHEPDGMLYLPAAAVALLSWNN